MSKNISFYLILPSKTLGSRVPAMNFETKSARRGEEVQVDCVCVCVHCNIINQVEQHKHKMIRGT